MRSSLHWIAFYLPYQWPRQNSSGNASYFQATAFKAESSEGRSSRPSFVRTDPLRDQFVRDKTAVDSVEKTNPSAKPRLIHAASLDPDLKDIVDRLVPILVKNYLAENQKDKAA
jgi:hypothetical protein